MCFTIHIHSSRSSIEKKYQVDTSSLADFQFRYFFKAFEHPMIPVIPMMQPDRVILAQWGLIPHWTSDLQHANELRKGTYNARFESLLDKPSFEIPALKQRCLVVTNGFFEWQHLGKERIPWFIRGENSTFLTMAGIVDNWKMDAKGDAVQTFSIVTTAASPLMEKIHNTKMRMPLILDDKTIASWLDPGLEADNWDWIVEKTLKIPLTAHPVSKNLSAKNADPLDPSSIEKFDHYISGRLF